MVVDGAVHGQVTPEQAVKIVDEIIAGEAGAR
jgi:(2Fe-2S) ferredoxin